MSPGLRRLGAMAGVPAVLVVLLAELLLFDVMGGSLAEHAIAQGATAIGIPYNSLVVILGTGALGMAGGLAGSFAVLRGRALLGDAVAHSALPGLGIAYLILRRRQFEVMLVGAILSGWLGVTIIAWMRRHTRIKNDAAVGLVLSVFFAAGLAISGIVQSDTSGNQAGLDTFLLGKTAGMLGRDVLLIILVALNIVAILAVFAKEFTLISFDANFAAVQGFPVASLDMFLMGLLVVATVIGLPAVGVVLMAGMLILPPVAARFWTDDLGALLWLSGSFGAAMGILGTLLSAVFPDLPAGPVIILTGTAGVMASLVLAPQRGMLARARAGREIIAPDEQG